MWMPRWMAREIQLLGSRATRLIGVHTLQRFPPPTRHRGGGRGWPKRGDVTATVDSPSDTSLPASAGASLLTSVLETKCLNNGRPRVTDWRRHFLDDRCLTHQSVAQEWDFRLSTLASLWGQSTERMSCLRLGIIPSIRYLCLHRNLFQSLTSLDAAFRQFATHR